MEETFKIENDKSADWAIRQIHEAESERDRLIALAQDQITDLEDRIEELSVKCDHDTAYLKSLLAEYFETVKSKETKTQKTYKLLSGTLVFKKPSAKINHDDDALLKYIDGNKILSSFVKVKKSVDWAELKKHLEIWDNDVVYDETGEIIKACTVEDVPASFTIKY